MNVQNIKLKNKWSFWGIRNEYSTYIQQVCITLNKSYSKQDFYIVKTENEIIGFHRHIKQHNRFQHR